MPKTKKRKIGIAAGVVAAIVLLASFGFGGSSNENKGTINLTMWNGIPKLLLPMSWEKS